MRRFNIIKPRDTSINHDTRRDRKRKFPDARSHNMQNVRPNVRSEQCPSVQEPISDGAKTSEFAYFKKLKKEAAQSELHPRDREKSQYTDVKWNHYEREKTEKLKQIFNEPKSSVPIGTERSSDHPCLTPPVRAPKSSEINNMVEISDKDIIIPLLIEKVTTPSGYNHQPSFPRFYPNNTVQHCDKGIFGLKRRNLRQWVSGTLHQGIDEFSSEGLVPMLLNRLFPEDNKENRDWESKYSQAEISAQDQLAWIPDDDDNTHSREQIPDDDDNTHSRGHYRTHKNRFLKSEDDYEDFFFTKNLSERHGDVVLPELENGGAYSPSTTPCINMKPYHKIDVSITEKFFPESNSARYEFPLFPHDNTHSKGHYWAHTNHLLEFGNAGFQDYKEHRDWEPKYSDQAEIRAQDQLPWIPNDDDNTRHSTGHYGMLKNYLMESEDAAYGDYYFTQNLCECPRDMKGLPELEVGGGEPHTLLLGWDYSNEKDEQDSLKYLCGPSEDFSTNNQSEMRNAVVSTQDHFWNPNKVKCENNFHDQKSLQGEEDKECFLYDPRWTSDCTNSINFQDLSALNIWRSRDTRVSIQRHSTSWEFPILERYRTEADEDSICDFE